MTAHRPHLLRTHRLRLVVAVIAGTVMVTGFTLAAGASPQPQRWTRPPRHRSRPSCSSTAPLPTQLEPRRRRLLGEGSPSSRSRTRFAGPRRCRVLAPASVDHRRAGRARRALLRRSGDHHCRDGDPDVKALVYIAAYALDEGESVAAANALGGGHTDVIDHLVVRPFPGATGGDADAYIDPASSRPCSRRTCPSQPRV